MANVRPSSRENEPNFPGFVSLPDERIEDVPPVKRYTLYSADPTESTQPTTYKVKVELEGGRIIDDIDVVWVGTGYKPYVPWLHVLPPPFQDPELDTARQAGKTVPIMSLLRFNLPETLADSSNSASDNNSQAKPNSVSNWHSRIPLLYRHLLFALSPSLAFVLSTMSYTPFTIADLGSLWIGLAWSDDEEWAAHTNTDIEAKDSKGQANGVVVDGHGESVRSGMTGDHSSKKGGKGRVTYPATIEERLKYERNKLELIESGRKEVAASVSSSSSSTFTVTTDGGSTAASDSTSESSPNSNSSETQPRVPTGPDSSKTTSANTPNHFGTTETTFTPTPTLLSAWLRGINGSTPSALNSYSVLGAYEEEYAKTLREDVVRARPYLGAQQRLWSSTSTDSGSETELESESKSKEQTRTDDVEGNPGETSDEKGLYKTLGGGLPEWGPERTKKREGMYPVKLASLYWMRERGRGGNRENVETVRLRHDKAMHRSTVGTRAINSGLVR
ncbi:hypothetical protein K435DRAFT_856886 [Dendrothele bispora CBS 962.96]|uniref:FAD/NAD(P)-binding domain-containing protein n=1 Tax=Dendrothele bispora (strain CBS 962.96) TaxID=1314807 RepID=A0A4S8M7G3_DENBC|nr:hypothetical protein K435DRAFT_856886 [Dendrothele bispora CBS 962.96]